MRKDFPAKRLSFGKIVGFCAGEVFHTIPTFRSVSGAPIFSSDGALLGVPRAGGPSTGKAESLFNVAVRFDMFFWRVFGEPGMIGDLKGTFIDKRRAETREDWNELGIKMP